MDVSSELVQFHEFLAEKLANGSGQVSPEEALDEWRTTHPSPESLAGDYEAVRQALADMEAGDRGTPFDDSTAGSAPNTGCRAEHSGGA